MPDSAERRDHALVDTSVAVALSVSTHPDHEATHTVIAGRRLGLAGHAAFETYSVLTRLPQPARRSAASVARLLAVNFPATCHLSPLGAAMLVDECAAGAISGGAIYDALVGAAAREHQLVLITRDRRAVRTYQALGVSIEMLA
ncbi:MAG TPA: type II toxin-antitoxin system VapC family toxin [Ilumatobacteraceae bacterium]|nr:type II toxin-antitoxin system VapC family toxin [Ilumatobacteraceae bacterium]